MQANLSESQPYATIIIIVDFWIFLMCDMQCILYLVCLKTSVKTYGTLQYLENWFCVGMLLDLMHWHNKFGFKIKYGGSGDQGIPRLPWVTNPREKTLEIGMWSYYPVVFSKNSVLIIFQLVLFFILFFQRLRTAVIASRGFYHQYVVLTVIPSSDSTGSSSSRSH